MDVTVKEVSSTSRDYRFTQPIDKDMDWLDDNRHIDRYEVSDRTLTIHASSGVNWDTLESSFIIPGLEKAFGTTLKTHQYA